MTTDINTRYQVYESNTDPRLAPGVFAPINALLIYTGFPAQLFYKFAAGDTDWSVLPAQFMARMQAQFYDDFLGDTLSNFALAGGATNAFGSALGSIRPGTVTSTALAVGASARINPGNFSSIIFGGGFTTFEWAGQLNSLGLPTAAQDFFIHLGFTNSNGGAPTEGLFLELDRANGNTNYWFTAVNGGVFSRVDTGVAAGVADQFYLRILVNAIGSSAQVFINEIAPPTSTLGVGLPVQATRPQIHLEKTAGVLVAGRVISDMYRYSRGPNTIGR